MEENKDNVGQGGGTGSAMVVAAKATRPVPQVQNVQPLFETDRFEHFQRAANALMNSSLLPESVRGNSPAQCFSNLMLVFDLSDRWKVPALSIAQCIAIVHGKVVYEGKLISAMMQASLGTRLFHHYVGERGTPGYRIFVSDCDFAQFGDEVLAALAPGKYPKGVRMVDGSVDEWRTFQKDGKPNSAWSGAATMRQLQYRGDREWARAHEPGVMLGVYGEDEVDQYVLTQTDRPAATVITAGFANGAIDADFAPLDAQEPDQEAQAAKVAEWVAAGQKAAQASQDATAKAKRAPAADKAAADIPAGQEGWSEGQRKDHAKLQAAGAEAAKVAAKIEAARADGYASRQRGQDHAPLGLNGDEGAAWRDGWVQADNELDVGDDEKESADPDQGQPELAGKSKVQQARETLELADKAEELADKLEAAGDAGPAIDAGGREGVALDAFEAGFGAGYTGDELKVPRAWTQFAEDFTAGFHAGAAAAMDEDQADDGDDDEEEEAGESTGNEMLDAIREVEPELVDQVLADHAGEEANPFDAFASEVTRLDGWGMIKAALGALSATPEWKEAAQTNPDAIRAARISAWLRVQQLEAPHQAESAPQVSPTQDLIAFRCFMEATEDPARIQTEWQALVQTQLFQSLKPEQKARIEAPVRDRMGVLLANG